MSTSVVVETVIALTAEQKKLLLVLLAKKFGATEFVAKLNPALLGGIRVTVGSTQYDASVFGKLETLRAQ